MIAAVLRRLGIVVDVMERDDAARWLLGREVKFRHEPVIVEVRA